MYMRKKVSIIGNKIGIHVEALVVVQAYHSVAANLIGIMHKLCLWIIRQISDKLNLMKINVQLLQKFGGVK